MKEKCYIFYTVYVYAFKKNKHWIDILRQNMINRDEIALLSLSRLLHEEI